MNSLFGQWLAKFDLGPSLFLWKAARDEDGAANGSSALDQLLPKNQLEQMLGSGYQLDRKSHRFAGATCKRERLPGVVQRLCWTGAT